MKLKGSQVEFIEEDLLRRGISFENLREDLVDHICSEVENRMESGTPFMDAYREAIRPFSARGMSQLNQEATTNLNTLTMLRSYFSLTMRNILKHKVFLVVNIAGLAIGMAACFIILQYVNYEWSFDKFHANSDSIYRITQKTEREDGSPFHTATAYLPIASVVKEEFPEVVDFNRLYFLDRHAVVSYEDRKFEQEAVLYADANFFEFFSYELTTGTASDVLQEVNSVALSETAALKYFDRSDPVGKIVKLTEEFNELTLLVTGVFKDPPPNSHLKPHMVVSMSSYENLPDTKENYWNWPFYMNYVQLRADADPKSLEAGLPDIVAKYFSEDEREKSALFLQPLEDIHLQSKLNYEIETNGDGTLVFLLLGVALLTLVIAYANYINLSTARSLERAKEVGIRKALGSRKSGLVKQFLIEAMLINSIAFIGAAALVQLSRYTFYEYAGLQAELFVFTGIWFWCGLLLLFLIGSVLSSLYPAFVLSSFQPIAALRGKLNYSLGGQQLRRTLVLFQFVASISLMIAAFAVYDQLQYMREKPLGMQIDNLLVVKGPRVMANEMETSEDPFITIVSRNRAVQNVSVSGSVPGIWTASAQNIVRQGSQVGKDVFFSIFGADHRFLETYELELLAGRNFKEGIDGSREAVILNESALLALGFDTPEDAINANIEARGLEMKIVGVIRDYHHFSLKEKINPMILFPIGNGSKEYYTVKVESIDGQFKSTISEIESNWKTIYPDNPFEYFFLNSAFDAQYAADLQFEKVFTAFSLLAVFIACLGLYGLASFVTMKRTKEIGIRKVLGSSVTGIVILLLMDFAKLILVAGLIAVPIAYLGVMDWQSTFAFKADLSPWLFVIPLVAVLSIALLTISIQTLRAAIVNPVDILKYD
ncbi:MAG: ABC transporter permease [Cyclobacteriaceae bacterium]